VLCSGTHVLCSGTQVLCDACLCSLRPLGPPVCDRCGAPTLWPVDRCRECAGRRLAFASARAAVAYTGAARPFVAAWKEHGLRRAATQAAELLAHAVERPAADVIAYIPSDPQRLLERGHHPAEHLARALGRAWELDVERLLARSKEAAARPRQATLHRDERLRNARGAFAAAVDRVPTRVLLVDDVYTTGATVNAGASALRAAGARRVEVVTFARTVRG
jgi:predicted amidophosphoribosyltransferase